MEIVLYILVYLFIGGCIARLVNHPDLDAICRFVWPMVVVFAVAAIVSELGASVVDALVKFFNIDKENTR